MSTDRNKYNIDNIFNSLDELDSVLKTLSNKVYLRRAVDSPNKASSTFSFIVGGLSLASSILLGLKLDRVLFTEVMTIMGLFYGIKLRKAFANTNFGKLVETPLSFEVWDKVANKKMSPADVATNKIDIPDPVKFYELTTSDILLKTKNQQYQNSGYTSIDKDSGKWENILPDSIGLVFDDKSKEVVKKIIEEYQNPEVKSKIFKLAPGAVAIGAAAAHYATLPLTNRPKPSATTTDPAATTKDLAAIGSLPSVRKNTKPSKWSRFKARGKDVLKGL